MTVTRGMASIVAEMLGPGSSQATWPPGTLADSPADPEGHQGGGLP